MLLDKIPKETIVKVEMPTDVVSIEGRSKIQDLLYSRADLELPKYWTWEWMVSKGTYAGTLPKRIAQFAYKEAGKKLSVEIIAEVGNIARANSDSNKAFWIDLTQKFDWQDGDFADWGSCFWGGRDGAMEMLRQYGAYAMRFWTPISEFKLEDVENAKNSPRTHASKMLRQWKYGKKHPDGLIGLGRSWVGEKNGMLAVFNTYGEHQSVTSARILATLLGLSYESVTLLNNGVEDGELWINSGKGYVVGSPEVVRKLEVLDLKWAEIRRATCDHCGNTETTQGQYARQEDGIFCPACARLIRCKGCGEPHPSYKTDRQYSYRGSELLINVCRNCLGNRQSCAQCNFSVIPKYLKKLSVYGAPSIPVCQGCYNETTPCLECGELEFSLIEGKCRPCFYGLKGVTNVKKQKEKAPKAKSKKSKASTS